MGARRRRIAADARDVDALAERLEGCDVLVNTASYRINLEAMQACLKAGSNYLDLGGLYWMTGRQLELGEEFERAGLIAVLGIGSSPGKTNLMAARGVRELGSPEAIESIEVCAAGRDPAAAAGAGDGDGRLRPPYAIQTLLDELTLAPVVIRDAQAREIEPLSDGGEVDFGEPIGTAETIFTLHSELASFGESFGCREASFRLSLAPALLEGLRELVGAAPEKVAAAARGAVSPSAETVSVHLVKVTGGPGHSATVRALTRPHFGLGGSIVSTAAPIAAAVRLLARGSLSANGRAPSGAVPRRGRDVRRARDPRLQLYRYSLSAVAGCGWPRSHSTVCAIPARRSVPASHPSRRLAFSTDGHRRCTSTAKLGR